MIAFWTIFARLSRSKAMHDIPGGRILTTTFVVSISLMDIASF